MAPASGTPSPLATATAFARSPRGRTLLLAGLALALLLIASHGLGGIHPGKGGRVWPSAFGSGATIQRADWDATPDWDGGYCRRLLADPRPYEANCTREGDELACSNGEEQMFSQFRQDYYLYMNHFRHLRRRGVYLDVAANQPIHISSTAFFDRCLGWAGTCVEGNPKYYEGLWRQRSCDLVPTCVGEVDGEMVNFTFADGGGGVTETNKNAVSWNKHQSSFPSQVLRCTTLDRVVARSGHVDVDFFNLDVEGHELPVLRGINWATTRIKVIMVEASHTTFPGIKELLAEQGFEHRGQGVNEHGDSLFVHRSVKWGSPE